MKKRKQAHLYTWIVVIGIALSVAAGAFILSQSPAPSTLTVKHSTMPEHAPPQPEWLMNSMQPVKEAYYFAARNHDILKYIPCYCGCGAQHANNAECYFKWDEKTQITDYDQHAYG